MGQPAVENCGLRWGETAGGGWAQPPSGGFANEARNFQLPGVLCGFHPRTIGAVMGVGPGTAGSWKLRPSPAKPRGGWSQPQQGGLADEARNFQLPGVLCGFHPRAVAAADGVWSDTAGSWKLRPSWGETAGRLVAAPARGLGK